MAAVHHRNILQSASHGKFLIVTGWLRLESDALLTLFEMG